jgi:TonB family protein
MTRIFAPPTRDTFLHPDGAYGSLLLVHFAAFAILLFPPGEVDSKEQLLERMVVFLVPPDLEVSREASSGESGWGVDQSEGPPESGIAEVEPGGETGFARQRGAPSLGDSLLTVSMALEAEKGALTVLEVDSAVVRDPASAVPDYPAHLLRQGVEGLAQVRYVVDTLGSVDTLSYRVLQVSHADFAVSVRRALPNMRFRPAIQSGRRVRQLIEQTFRFQINPTGTKPAN